MDGAICFAGTEFEAELFAVLHWSIITFHLICAHLAAAGPLVSVAMEWWGRRRDLPRFILAGRFLAMSSLVSLLIAALLGGALAGLLWSEPSNRTFSVLARLPPAQLWSFVAEILFYIVCMTLYIAFWPGEKSCPALYWLHRLLALLAATNLLYHFPPFFTAVAIASGDPSLADGPIHADTFKQIRFSPQTWVLTVHHWLAAVAVTGVQLLAAPVLLPHQGNEVREPGISILGARLALGATLLQFVVGPMIFSFLPGNLQLALLGRDPLVMSMFAVSLLLTLLLVYRLITASVEPSSRADAVLIAALLLAVIFLMTGTLDRVRSTGL